MSYTGYTTTDVFADARQNAISDYLHEKLIEAFPDDNPIANFVLSGKAAAILREVAIGTISNITFETDSPVIYDWLVKNLGTIVFNCPQISFKNRILFYPQPDLFFEIWFASIPVEGGSFGNIKIQSIENIPRQTL